MPPSESSICIVVYKIDRFGRSVLHLNQQLAALTSYGVRFIATSQSLDTDEKNPTSRLTAPNPRQRCGIRAGDDPGANAIRHPGCSSCR